MSIDTRETLLQRIKDPGSNADWTEFRDIYGPLIYGYARKRGLQEADARDLVQECLTAVFRAIERFEYDREKGRFRSWLFTIASRKLSDHLRRGGRQPAGTGDTRVMQCLNAQADINDELKRRSDLEEARRMFELASAGVRGECEERTWAAFWLTEMEGMSNQEAAAELEMTAGAVAIAKCRIKARLRTFSEELLSR